MKPLPDVLAHDPQVVAYLDRRIRDAVTAVYLRGIVISFVVGMALGAGIAWLVVR